MGLQFLELITQLTTKTLKLLLIEFLRNLKEKIEYKKEIMQNDNIKIKCLTDNNYNCLVIFETDNKMNAVVELKLL